MTAEIRTRNPAVPHKSPRTSWKTYAAHGRTWLEGLGPGVVLTGEDHVAAVELLELHDTRRHLIGDGVTQFITFTAPGSGRTCLAVERTDGTLASLTVLNPHRTISTHPHFAALRSTIQPQLLDYLGAQASPSCAECGATTDLTVDHVEPPFRVIATDWLDAQGDELAWHYDELIGRETAWHGAVPLRLGIARNREKLGTIPRISLSDADQAESFAQYHEARAVYAVLCRSCNSSKGTRPAKAAA